LVATPVARHLCVEILLNTCCFSLCLVFSALLRVLRGYPELKRADIQAVLDYAGVPFCTGKSLPLARLD
jgi:hypothetical protein